MLLRWIFIFLLLSLSLCQTQAQNANMILIDGVRLEYLDIGSGRHTLVLETGVGQGLAYWQPMLAELSRLNLRTVLYSRAGNGQSGPATDISLAASNQRLAKLLTALGIDNQLIVVGHSFGGLHARTFAARGPKRVSALLLLAPSHEHFASALQQYDAAWAARDNNTLNDMLQGQPEWQLLQSIYQQNAIANAEVTQRIPLLLVSSPKLQESDWWIGHSVEGKRIWRRLRQALMAQNLNAIHWVSGQTGHNIPHENKALVLAAIKTLQLMLVDEAMAP